jgi:hypothetical protein
MCVLQNGKVSLEELQQILKAASKEYSHFEEHAKFLEAKNSRWACGPLCVCVTQHAHGFVLAWQLQEVRADMAAA